MSGWARSAIYWVGLIVTVLVMDGVALYYQYRLDYWPCVLCIHVRIWLVLLGLIAIPVVLLRKTPVVFVGHVAVLLIGSGLGYTSWQLLGIERGFIRGGICEMGLGLPGWLSWLKLDQWMPWLFEVQTPCGYTPELLFGITMAEALLAFSAVLVVVSAVLLVSAVTLRRAE